MDTEFIYVPKEPFLNKALSLKAKGLLAVLLAQQPQWSNSLRELNESTGAGIHAVSTAVKELEAAGILKRTQIRENGRLSSAEYQIALRREEFV